MVIEDTLMRVYHNSLSVTTGQQDQPALLICLVAATSPELMSGVILSASMGFSLVYQIAGMVLGSVSESRVAEISQESQVIGSQNPPTVNVLRDKSVSSEIQPDAVAKKQPRRSM